MVVGVEIDVPGSSADGAPAEGDASTHSSAGARAGVWPGGCERGLYSLLHYRVAFRTPIRWNLVVGVVCAVAYVHPSGVARLRQVDGGLHLSLGHAQHDVPE